MYVYYNAAYSGGGQWMIGTSSTCANEGGMVVAASTSLAPSDVSNWMEWRANGCFAWCSSVTSTCSDVSTASPPSPPPPPISLTCGPGCCQLQLTGTTYGDGTQYNAVPLMVFEGVYEYSGECGGFPAYVCSRCWPTSRLYYYPTPTWASSGQWVIGVGSCGVNSGLPVGSSNGAPSSVPYAPTEVVTWYEMNQGTAATLMCATAVVTPVLPPPTSGDGGKAPPSPPSPSPHPPSPPTPLSPLPCPLMPSPPPPTQLRRGSWPPPPPRTWSPPSPEPRTATTADVVTATTAEPTPTRTFTTTRSANATPTVRRSRRSARRIATAATILAPASTWNHHSLCLRPCRDSSPPRPITAENHHQNCRTRQSAYRSG